MTRWGRGREGSKSKRERGGGEPQVGRAWHCFRHQWNRAGCSTRPGKTCMHPKPAFRRRPTTKAKPSQPQAAAMFFSFPPNSLFFSRASRTMALLVISVRVRRRKRRKAHNAENMPMKPTPPTAVQVRGAASQVPEVHSLTFTAYPRALISSRTASAVAQSLLFLAASRLASSSVITSGNSPSSPSPSTPAPWLTSYPAGS